MFTQGTKHLGIWRAGHPSLNRHTGRPTQAILLAYGFCAFLTWFIFIITLKIRGEFFLVESLSVPLHSIAADGGGGGGASHVPSPESTSLAIRPSGSKGQLRVILDTGDTFLIPQERSAFESYLVKRAERIELSAMLSKSAGAGRSTAVFWVDEAVSLSDASTLARLVVRTGYDTIQYAVSSAHNAAAEAH